MGPRRYRAQIEHLGAERGYLRGPNPEYASSILLNAVMMPRRAMPWPGLRGRLRMLSTVRDLCEVHDQVLQPDAAPEIDDLPRSPKRGRFIRCGR